MGWLRKGWNQTYGALWDRVTNAPDPNRNNPQNPGYNGPGAGYGEPRSGGFTWFPNAGQRILQDHPLNAQGLPEGYNGLIPHDIALQVQSAHERAIWEQQQAEMQDAVRGARGAASLLSSFRPGGGAAIESGVYGQVANLQMQRAAMTKPLDLLADYRREADTQARMQANRAAERTLAVQAIGTAASLFTGGAGGVAAAALMNQGAGQVQPQPQRQATPQEGGQGAGAPGAQAQLQYGPPQSLMAPQGQAPQGPQSAMGAPAGGGYGPGGGSAIGAPSGGGYEATLGPEGGQPISGPDQQGGGGFGQRGAAGGGGAAAMGGMGGGGVGADGVFDSRAYAADAMRQPVMQHPIVKLAAANTAVNMMDESGLIPALTYAANKALAMRLAG